MHKATNASNSALTDFTLAASATSGSTTGSITNGGFVVTVVNVTPFAVGQQIQIAGADPSSGTGNLTATIQSINAGAKQLTLSDNANASVAGHRKSPNTVSAVRRSPKSAVSMSPSHRRRTRRSRFTR